MKTYKVLKGTKKTLYLKGLKSNYFYLFCFSGIGGALVIVFLGMPDSILLHFFIALVYVIVAYFFFFYLSLDRSFKNIKKKYSLIRNVDLIKLLKK